MFLCFLAVCKSAKNYEGFSSEVFKFGSLCSSMISVGKMVSYNICAKKVFVRFLDFVRFLTLLCRQ